MNDHITIAGNRCASSERNRKISGPDNLITSLHMRGEFLSILRYTGLAVFLCIFGCVFFCQNANAREFEEITRIRTEKKAYRQISRAYSSGNFDTAFISGDANVRKAVRYAGRHAQNGIWLVTKGASFRWSDDPEGESVKGYFVEPYFTSYRSAVYKIGAANKKADAVAKSIKKRYKSDLDRIKAAHDYLCENIVYYEDEYSKDIVRTSYGALINGRAVCVGYAEAFDLLMEKLEIPCIIVSGSARTRSGTEGHAWNAVLYKGKMRYVDVTWDDKGGFADYTYFLKDEAFFKTNHIWKKKNYPMKYLKWA